MISYKSTDLEDDSLGKESFDNTATYYEVALLLCGYTG